MKAEVEPKAQKNPNPVDLHMHCKDDRLDALELIAVERHSIGRKGLDLLHCLRQLVVTSPFLQLRVVLHYDAAQLLVLDLFDLVLIDFDLLDT